jgi:predicted anti-sigma-YlaC factor YlaD
MNCKKARDILNSVFDGEEHALAAEASEHVRECDWCREWYATTMRALDLMRSSSEPPVPDIAAMVARTLPGVHRASARGRPSRRALWLLTGLAACWVIGGGALVVGLMAALRWLSIGSIVDAYSSARTIAGALGGLAAAGRAVVQVAWHVLSGLGGALAGLGPVLLTVVAIDLAGLAIILLLCRRRPRITSACLI